MEDNGGDRSEGIVKIQFLYELWPLALQKRSVQ